MRMNTKQLGLEFTENWQGAKITQKGATMAIEAMFEMIADNLQQGHEINIPGFGKFAVKDKPERQARNPKTGETMTVPAKRVFKFTPAKALKERLA